MSTHYGFLIESMVSVLLLLTILYCVRLNNQLRLLKSDEQSLRATISELITATVDVRIDRPNAGTGTNRYGEDCARNIIVTNAGCVIAVQNRASLPLAQGSCSNGTDSIQTRADDCAQWA